MWRKPRPAQGICFPTPAPQPSYGKLKTSGLCKRFGRSSCCTRREINRLRFSVGQRDGQKIRGKIVSDDFGSIVTRQTNGDESLEESALMDRALRLPEMV